MSARDAGLVAVSVWEGARLAIMVVLVMTYWSTNPLNAVNLVWLATGWLVLALVLAAMARDARLRAPLKPVAVIALLAALAGDAVVVVSTSASHTPLLQSGPVYLPPVIRFWAVIAVLVADVLAATFLISFPVEKNARGSAGELPAYQETTIEGE